MYTYIHGRFPFTGVSGSTVNKTYKKYNSILLSHFHVWFEGGVADVLK